VVEESDLERRMQDIAMSWGGKNNARAFMCETPKGVSHLVRQSATMTCGHRGFGETDVRLLEEEMCSLGMPHICQHDHVTQDLPGFPGKGCTLAR